MSRPPLRPPSKPCSRSFGTGPGPVSPASGFGRGVLAAGLVGAGPELGTAPLGGGCGLRARGGLTCSWGDGLWGGGLGAAYDAGFDGCEGRLAECFHHGAAEAVAGVFGLLATRLRALVNSSGGAQIIRPLQQFVHG